MYDDGLEILPPAKTIEVKTPRYLVRSFSLTCRQMIKRCNFYSTLILSIYCLKREIVSKKVAPFAHLSKCETHGTHRGNVILRVSKIEEKYTLQSQFANRVRYRVVAA